MLILTTTTLQSDLPPPLLDHWPGLHVLVVLPDSGANATRLRAWQERFVVVEWLQPPRNSATLLADIFGWLKTRLHLDTGPLLYLDQKLTRKTLRALDPDVPPYAVLSEMGPGQNLTRLALGDMIVTSPLFPGLLQMLAARDIGDAQLTDVITTELAWENT